MSRPSTATATIILGSLLGLSLSKSVLSEPSNIVPDNTLGAQNSIVTPNYQNKPIEVITGGAQNGQNLFHSFREFNVSTGRGAYFYVLDAATRNVLVRITGSNISNINGTLGTFGQASPNLFLMNPNGILFGPNASLDLGGAFIATTANAIGLGNQGIFSATAPETSNLLSIQPSALFINKLNPIPTIVNESTATSSDPNTTLNSNNTPFNGLQVANGQNLLLIGGDVSLEQGGQITAPGGTIQLGGLSSNGTIGINSDGSLNYPTGVTLSNVTLSGGATVNVASGGGGSITINANNVTLSGASSLNAGIASGLGNANAQAGDITVNATGNIALTDSSFLANTVADSSSMGNAGNITIQANNLSLTGGGQIDSSTYGQGNGGNMLIKIARDVTLSGLDPSFTYASGFVSAVSPSAVGNAGNITITANNLSLSDGAQINSSTYGRGNAGNMLIKVASDVTLSGFDPSVTYASGFVNTVQRSGVGNAGNITIQANNLSVSGGGQISSGTFGQGNAGNVLIKVADDVHVSGVNPSGTYPSAIVSNVQPSGVGNAGNITLQANNLSVSGGGVINSSTYGQGNAGNMLINVASDVTLSGFDPSGTYSSAIGGTVESSGVGNAGNITIQANNLSLSDGAQISSSTDGRGNAGNVLINVAEDVHVSGVNFNSTSPSVIASSVDPSGVGNAGNITIHSNNLSVSGGANISSATFGQGNAGNVLINVASDVTLSGVNFSDTTFSTIGSSVQTGAVGSAGNITLQANNLSVSGSAQIDSSTNGQGNAGNVNIKILGDVTLSGVDPSGTYFSKIASGVQPSGVGNAGNITIHSNNLSVSGGGEISSSTLGDGNAGSITINANNAKLTEGGEINSFTATGSLAGNITLNLTNNLTIEGLKPVYNPSNKGTISSASGIFANTISGSTGKGGSIFIYTPTTVIQNGGAIGVNSQGTAEGGNITLTGGNLTLNQGKISAETVSNNGGNINLNLGGTLLLQNNSNITTTAGTAFAGGNGGNIDINAQFIIAFPQEDSNITANAYSGNGGNISITTQGLFGLNYQNEPTTFSEITASSQFGVDGLVNINLLRNENLEKVATLPNTPIDVSEIVEQRCLGSTIARNNKESQFIQTGRGGLPSNPNEPPAPEAVFSSSWMTVDSSSARGVTEVQTSLTPTNKIVEATGWRRNANGDIELIATGTTVNPEPVSNSCSGVK